jgi:putative phage-type endonuclease
MYKNLLKKIPTKDMSRDEWLEHRRQSIGGSDAAAIIGLNNWSSPYYVWAEKLGKIPPKEDTESMRLGRDLEDYVAKRFTEKTGKKVRRENNILVNHIYPFAHANVDRMIVGEDAGLECKTTSALNLKKFKGGEYPEHYYVQCVHYMAVTGCRRWYLAVLVLGEGFYHFVIERDEGEIKALMDSEREFWGFVQSKTPPPTDGSKSTTEAISVLYPEDNGNSVSLMAYESDIQQYMELTEQIKDLERLRDKAANKVKSFLGESARGETNNYKVSWASASRSTFDSKRFAKEHPEIDLSGYYKTSAYRTFKISENSK